MKSITFVTGNKNKIREAEQILGIKLEVADIDLDEIQEIDLEKVALHKLRQAYNIVKKPVLVDDVGVYIHAWGNFPGPLVKWMLKAGDNSPKLLLDMLAKEKERRATVKLAVGFHDGKKAQLFLGTVEGIIAKKPEGDNGFGWDSVFIPEGQKKTYAQMSSEEKNLISHRKKALDKLKDFIISYKEV